MLPLISNKISRRNPEMRSTLATGTITLPSFACKRSGVIPDKNVLLSSSTMIAGIICVQSCARAWHPANRTRKRSMRRIAALLYTTILLKHKTSGRACRRNKATGINFDPANRIFFPAGESVEQSFTGDHMPLVRISLLAGKPEGYKKKISDVVHRAMLETINVPTLDRFQIITE